MYSRLNVTLHSQTEKEEACYPFLSAPHVFGDLKERVDKRLWTKLCRLQQKFIRKAEAAAEKSASSKGQGRGRGKRCDKATNLQELGDKFLHAAAKLLDDNMNYFKKMGRLAAGLPDKVIPKQLQPQRPLFGRLGGRQGARVLTQSSTRTRLLGQLRSCGILCGQVAW